MRRDMFEYTLVYVKRVDKDKQIGRDLNINV